MSTYGGTMEFRELYLAGEPVEEISDSRDEGALWENGIFGYVGILKQTVYACGLLRRERSCRVVSERTAEWHADDAVSAM